MNTINVNTINLSDKIIKKVSGGGGGNNPVAIQENDVNFYDYDGTLLYAYTWKEALNLTELPPLPTKEGLICEGWNYELEDIKNQNGYCDIGAHYTTDDNSSLKLYIHIIYDEDKDISLQLDDYGSIDWGDGVIEQNNNQKYAYHKYNTIGHYIIRIFEYIGNYSNPICSTSYTGGSDAYKIKKIFLGTNRLKGFEFLPPNIEYINTPKNLRITNSNNSISLDIIGIKALILPKNVTLYSNRGEYNNNLKLLCFSPTLTVLDCTTSFNVLNKLIIPEGVTKINRNNCNGKYIRQLYLPKTLTTIGIYVFNSMYGIGYIKVNSVFDHPEGTFENLYSLKVIDYSSLTDIPIASNYRILLYASALNKIIIPTNLYYSWKDATNWAQYESKFYPADENIIRFSINNTHYIAHENITWGDWINSELYHGAFTIVDGVVMSDIINNVQLNNVNVLATDIISKEVNYTILTNETE